MTFNEVIELVTAERARQDAKWGRNTQDDPLWASGATSKYTVLGEEVGEIARAILEGDIVNLREELVQVAAVTICWLQSDF